MPCEACPVRMTEAVSTLYPHYSLDRESCRNIITFRPVNTVQEIPSLFYFLLSHSTEGLLGRSSFFLELFLSGCPSLHLVVYFSLDSDLGVLSHYRSHDWIFSFSFLSTVLESHLFINVSLGR